MDIIIKIIAVIFIVIGVAYLIKPGIIKWLLGFFKKGKRIYLAALLRFVLAVVFLLAARECNRPKIIGIFGVLFLIGGLLIFAIGSKKISSIIEWSQKQPDWLLRTLGLLPIIIAAIILYAA